MFLPVLFAETETETKTVLWNLVAWLLQKLRPEEGGTTYALLIIGGALLCVLVPYLLGSINPAILISRHVYHEDIRNFGSGNAGSTNMLRTYGKKAAAVTFILDLLKAAVAVWFGRFVWGANGAAIAGFFVMFGHMYPVFAKFKGGKGVACLAMVVLNISPITFLILLGIFLVIVIGTRFISMGSVMCALLYPLILRAFTGEEAGLAVAMAVLSAVFVTLRHRENLKRIWSGKEHKVSFSKLSRHKKDDAPEDASDDKPKKPEKNDNDDTDHE